MVLFKIESKKGQPKASRALKGAVALGRTAAKFSKEGDDVFLKIGNTVATRQGKAQFSGSVFLNCFPGRSSEKEKADEKCKRFCFPGLFHQHYRCVESSFYGFSTSNTSVTSNMS